MMNAVASLIAADDDKEIEKIVSDIKDPLGTFYQFGLPTSILKGSYDRVYTGPEKRKSMRTETSFVVSYRILEDTHAGQHVSQTKNISLGGMLLTTNKPFSPGTKLALEIYVPTDPHPLILVGIVVESNEVVKELVYDTRLELLSVDEEHRSAMHGTTGEVMK
jgi:hypothetical protein